MKDREQEVHDTTQRLMARLTRQMVLEWLHLGGCLRVWIRYGLPATLVLVTLWLFGPVCVDSACEVPWTALLALGVWPLTFLVDVSLPTWAVWMPPLRLWLMLGAMAALGIYQISGALGVRQR